MVLADRETGLPVDLALVDRNTGKVISEATHRSIPGSGASEQLKAHFAKRAERLARSSNPSLDKP